MASSASMKAAEYVLEIVLRQVEGVLRRTGLESRTEYGESTPFDAAWSIIATITFPEAPPPARQPSLLTIKAMAEWERQHSLTLPLEVRRLFAVRGLRAQCGDRLQVPFEDCRCTCSDCPNAKVFKNLSDMWVTNDWGSTTWDLATTPPENEDYAIPILKSRHDRFTWWAAWRHGGEKDSPRVYSTEGDTGFTRKDFQLTDVSLMSFLVEYADEVGRHMNLWCSLGCVYERSFTGMSCSECDAVRRKLRPERRQRWCVAGSKKIYSSASASPTPSALKWATA